MEWTLFIGGAVLYIAGLTVLPPKSSLGSYLYYYLGGVLVGAWINS